MFVLSVVRNKREPRYMQLSFFEVSLRSIFANKAYSFWWRMPWKKKSRRLLNPEKRESEKEWEISTPERDLHQARQVKLVYLCTGISNRWRRENVCQTGTHTWFHTFFFVSSAIARKTKKKKFSFQKIGHKIIVFAFAKNAFANRKLYFAQTVCCWLIREWFFSIQRSPLDTDTA